MNQDYVFVSENPVGNLPNLFVVADGMGGHNAGDYASSHAVQILVDEIRRDADFNPIKVIRHAIETANTEILNARRREEHSGEWERLSWWHSCGTLCICGQCRRQPPVCDPGADPPGDKRSFTGTGNGQNGRDQAGKGEEITRIKISLQERWVQREP